MAQDAGHDADHDARRSADERTRQLRRVLDAALRGDVTRDEVAPSGQVHQTRTDEEYLADRPPHHG